MKKFLMHVISVKKLKAFIEKHPEAAAALWSWYKVVVHSDFKTSKDLAECFSQVDYVKPFHVFNIGRANRLICAIHFDRKKVFIRHVLTHHEYDRGKWKGT